ncbi:relaxase domain-containing protein [Chitinophaga agrisoli]|uniref:Relaxase domain-containing protein n=1 Tax=Chitinophaga agrisoli TaxID=2607653 RepID=A0A5B2VT84_9BACT|nr:MobF family relaxase [Chitinophaga agrisoli]KAA2241532.1 relaxase domain-containing protein [Chitinophaga agrisoli]
MIRMIPSSSESQAKAYFSDVLSKSDYYINDQELQGQFRGLLAERLGIDKPATKGIFYLLCENKNPVTGGSLTPRTKEARIVGYDINFHCPKSLSILHMLAKDNHIMDAFQQSVYETMREIEAESRTRVRKKGAYDDRVTAELAWAEFIHQTARPVGYVPDPHLHAHCFVFNATWDAQEKEIKAGKFRDIKRDMPYFQARFHKRLSDKMIALGYRVRRTDHSFEIEGVPQAAIDHFSKRTNEIGQIAKEKGITDAKELAELGARTRRKKQKKGLGMDVLKTEWKKQIRLLNGDKNLDQGQSIRFATVKETQTPQPEQSVDYALRHCFERASVKPDRRILEHAYRHAIGSPGVSLDTITDCFLRDDRLLHVKQGSQTFTTTKEVLTEEKRMVELARDGRGKFAPLYPQEVPDIKLDAQQSKAVRHVLTTKNLISIIRGAAGTGKTKLMQQAVALIGKIGKKVIVVAPTIEASHGVLKEDGFKDAETVAKLLSSPGLQNSLNGQVLWVDEAGMLGTKDMTALIELATKKNARLILGGDTRQHSAVVRGDALRILNTVGGIKAAEVEKIYRQKNEYYRAAVEDLSKGAIGDAFEKLESMGSIKNVDLLNPHEALVNDYTDALKRKKSALVISPTHKHGDAVTAEIRKKLRQLGLIGKKEITVKWLVNLNLTQADKEDWRSFRDGHVIQFNQHVAGGKRGSVWAVKSTSDRDVIIQDTEGKTMSLPRDKASRFDVYRKTEIGISTGDSVKITRDSLDEKKKRLNNGMTFDVVAIDKKGNIILRNKRSKATYSLKADFGHMTHAHCITSHASQGKTVDEVFIAQPASTFPATDLKQFYVSVSRGKHNVSIYTDDKAALLEHASNMRDRYSALELLSGETVHEQHIALKQRNDYASPGKDKAVTKDHLKNMATKDKDYEPEL